MTFAVVGLNPTIQRTVVLPRIDRGEVNRAREARVDASGKGMNVARVLTQADQEATLVCQVGGTLAGFWHEECKRDGVALLALPSPAELRTCVTLIDQSDASVTEIIEPSFAVGTSVVDDLFAHSVELLSRVDVLIIAGSAAAGFPPDTYRSLIESAKSVGCRVLVDFFGPALRDVLDLSPDVTKINLEELLLTFEPRKAAIERGAAPSTVGDDEERDRAEVHMRTIYERGSIPIVTRGKRATWIYDGAFREYETIEVDARNTIGCGDSFTAGFAVEFFDNGEIESAIHRAHTYAAMNAATLRPGSIRAS